MTSIVESYASLDLGSNSFHMIVASYEDGRLQVIDRLKETVRLASGLDDEGNLSEESIERALKCLERFGQRLREIPQINVRVVGTNTLRQAKNGSLFLERARQALGHPIEIVSGREEARLIFLGVAHTVFNDTQTRLVVDIGGGSTELITGKGFEPGQAESLYMGCVSMTHRFFEDGNITAKRMRKAVLAARQELESVERMFRFGNWDHAMGSSGSILAIQKIIGEKGWSEQGISHSSLRQLREAMVEKGKITSLDFSPLSDSRRPVLVGGVAILLAIFEALKIEVMTVSDGALREGLLHDLIGRLHEDDIRGRTVRDMAQWYNVDAEQAERVKQTVSYLFDQVVEDWGLDLQTDRKFICWAAEIHEIGLSIAHSQYHRHGAYLLAHSDMPGFSRQEQTILAQLVRNHRRKFISPADNLFPEPLSSHMLHLCVLFRLAVLINRSRHMTLLPEVRIKVDGTRVNLKFPADWLAGEPLTSADLETESGYLERMGISLDYQ